MGKGLESVNEKESGGGGQELLGSDKLSLGREGIPAGLRIS